MAYSVVAAVSAAAAGPTTVSQTFTYTGSAASFTVPSGITSLNVTVQGAEGGRGGPDASGPPPVGGYQGVVSGTVTVTPGQVLTVGVGQGGSTGPGGAGSNNPAQYTVGAPLGGSNPLGYNGGNGGVAGPQGSSGYGAGGGAASVLEIGGSTIVAGGSGGSGGSGQYTPTLGRLSYSTFSPRTDTTSTAGQNGITVATVCNNAPSPGCDGGGSGGGGGGAIGGAQGQVQFGSGTSNEWYGYGGYPGENSTGGFTGLSAAYQYYSDNNANGFVTISYTTGPPGAPTNLAGVAQDSAVALSWTAPANSGGADISDYVVQYAPASSPTSWTTFQDGTSTATSADVTGLADGTAYVFQVSAVNSFGTGSPSTTSASVSPSGPPSAPTISGLTPRDGALQVAFPATDSGSPILNYQYELNGSGQWVTAGTASSPFLISGLTNGTSYAVQIRAVSAIGVGPASVAVSGTPLAPPGAPTITSVTTGVGQATVAFTPGYLGGAAPTGYDYQLNGGAWVSTGTTTSPFTISGLANGTVYAIALRADSTSGNGTPSQPSTITTPDVPGAPTVSSIAAGDRTLSINVTPGSSGGTTVTGYQYQLTANGPWTDASSLSSPIVVTGLTNGTPYAVSVRAVNLVGPGAGSATQTATPATVPGAPTIVGSTVVGSDSQLSAAFTPPADNGGSAITRYEYSTDGGVTWLPRQDGGTTASPVAITTLSSDGTTPLENGTTYYVELRAVNAAGAGQASAVATGIASTTPSAPTVSAVTSGPSSLQVAFNPASNGGAAITGYEYQLNGGDWVDTGTLAGTFIINGLTNGTSYAVAVRALNGNGAGTASAAVSGTPATAPAQPTITGVTRLDKALSVTVADASDGGAPITGWQYSTDGGTTWATASAVGDQLSITTVSSNGTTQIANGTTYPIVVRAVNSAGSSVASLVTTVGPSAVPSAPTVTLSASDQSITAAFTVASNGGSPITAIEYRLNGGTWTDAGTLSSPFTILGLTNGTPYGVQIRADNAIGAGAASTPASATPAGLPGSPTAVVAVSDTSSADVSWTAPASDGGAPITSYVASAYTSLGSTTPTASCTTTQTSCTITGLTNSSAYYVSVVASNSTGSGTASSPRVSVTPLTRPAAPTLSSLTAGNALLTLAFAAGSAGDKPITGYQYQLNGGSWQNAGSTSSPLTLSGLTNGTSYTVALRAVSSAGVGAASTTLTGTPYTYPDAPSPLTITANGTNGSAVVTWQAPNSNGSPITSYTATAFNAASAGSQVSTCSTSGALTCTITGLTNATTYYVSLQAGNAAGLSVRSDPRVAVTPSLYPGAVSGVTGVAGDSQVALSWTPGSTGGSAITDYQIWYSSGGAYTQFADGTSTATSATVTGLTNGTAYTFKVYAVNTNGTGPASAASSPVTPLGAGTVPTVSTPVSTIDGFTFTINNYSAGTTYSLSATNGAVITRNGAAVTVSGLGAGQASTATVSAAVAGFTTTSVNEPGAALLTGVAPTFTALNRTDDGFSFQISNYVPGAVYAFDATNGADIAENGAQVTISGLNAGQGSDVTVTTTRAGYTSASATESGIALGAGTAPTVSAPVSTVDGFTFTITNYSSGADYSFAATNGGIVNQTGSAVTVSGLDAGASSTVTVSAAVAGFTTASVDVPGSALLAGSVPTFSAATRTPDGFTFQISNYLPGADYTIGATNGGIVNRNGSLVTISGLDAGDGSDVTVTVARDGYTTQSAVESSAALGTGIAPTLDDVASTAGGFTFDITNYSAGLLYTFDATDGATVVQSGSHVVVSGLGAGDPSTVTVTANDPDVSIASSTVDGSALLTGTAPALSDPVAADGGFGMTITNYQPDAVYSAVATYGNVAVDGPDVTVTGLDPSEASDVTVTVSRIGYTDESTTAPGVALGAGIVPTASNPVQTADGFTFDITNYDPGTDYTVGATNGAVVTRDGATVTVSGLDAGTDATVTLTAAVDGFTTTSLDVDGSALQTGVDPTFAPSTRTLDGFSFQISNYLPGALYTFSATNGAVITQTGSTVTVSGLGAGQSSDVTVTVTRDGYTDASAIESGTSLLVAAAPTLSTPLAADGGFSLSITNFSPDASYSVSATDGATVSIGGANITVTGLDPGASSTVTVTANQDGYAATSASATGTSLGTGTTPTLSLPVRTAGGFAFDITNYDPTATYALALTGGATFTRNGSHITVTGLAGGASSEVTVTVSAAGSLDASATVTGQALPSPVTPPTPPVTPKPPVTPTPTPTPTVTPTPAATPTPTPSASASDSTGPDTVSEFGTGVLGDAVPLTPAVAPSASPSATAKSPKGSSGPRGADAMELVPGVANVTIDGVGVKPKLVHGRSGVVLTAGGLTMELAAMVNGKMVTLKPGDFLTVQEGGHLAVVLRGFRSDTTASIWGHSRPMLLDHFSIGADNSGEAQFRLPAQMKAGDHTILATGTAWNGKPAVMAVGVRILAAAAAPVAAKHQPAASSTVDWWWLLLLLIPVAGFVFYLLARRRRDEDEEDLQSPEPGNDTPVFQAPRGLPRQRQSAAEPSELPQAPGMIQPRRPAPEEETIRIAEEDS